nr:appr-1-p processing [Tanacetum cinerariifolium]
MSSVFHYVGTRFCDGTRFAQRANQITNFSNSVGEARIIRLFKLPASHVIQTVGPYYDENSNVSALLSGAYRYLIC